MSVENETDIALRALIDEYGAAVAIPEILRKLSARCEAQAIMQADSPDEDDPYESLVYDSASGALDQILVNSFRLEDE